MVQCTDDAAGRQHRRCIVPKAVTQSSVPEDGRNYRPKQVELIEIINKSLLLHLVGYLYNWQMGFNSVFKGLRATCIAAKFLEYHKMPIFYLKIPLRKIFFQRLIFCLII